ncbi:hypothetical protein THASP1DRAFT_27116 [Thamnocephalis sphaerospora]|uniref:Uncharacterized protein n=1 Tax=Thamnocephalis sphaerospora TaxID=78915 RepID=A0A4P9XZA5_9FUNG|nr:hypothetical protein THASP1DRAFT_27116 [Thamnocephalis sphaerospora]|eukprot:RKP11081.1 hypothetical protein THASP1DRAFT_27116 [Thamnocephalis sphaerospora]
MAKSPRLRKEADVNAPGPRLYHLTLPTPDYHTAYEHRHISGRYMISCIRNHKCKTTTLDVFVVGASDALHHTVLGGDLRPLAVQGRWALLLQRQQGDSHACHLRLWDMGCNREGAVLLLAEYPESVCFLRVDDHSAVIYIMHQTKSDGILHWSVYRLSTDQSPALIQQDKIHLPNNTLIHASTHRFWTDNDRNRGHIFLVMQGQNMVQSIIAHSVPLTHSVYLAPSSVMHYPAPKLCATPLSKGFACYTDDKLVVYSAGETQPRCQFRLPVPTTYLPVIDNICFQHVVHHGQHHTSIVDADTGKVLPHALDDDVRIGAYAVLITGIVRIIPGRAELEVLDYGAA